MTTDKIQPFSAPGYEALAAVLLRAFNQAAEGKGKERHANALPFDKQPMQTIAAAHGVGFLTGQAAKKTQEAHGLPHGRAIAEILGAINYLAGAVIFMESEAVTAAQNDNLPTSWIDWKGNHKPALSIGAIVFVKLRNGDTLGANFASDFYWIKNGSARDIVAYQVVNG